MPKISIIVPVYRAEAVLPTCVESVFAQTFQDWELLLVCLLYTSIAGHSADYCWPCGSCRQVLFEFAPDLEVLIAKEGGDFVKLSLRELLAHGFGPKALL